MKFTAKKNDLLKSLDFVCSELKSSFYPYCGILAEDNMVKISGWDTTSIAKSFIYTEAEEKGLCYVDAFILRKIVKNSGDDNILMHFLKDKSKLKVVSGKSVILLNTVSEDVDFDPIKDEEFFSIVIENDILLHALKNSIYATDKTNFYFINIEVDGSEEEMRFVATDGSRLALAAIDINYDRHSFSTIIHKDSIKVLYNYLVKNKNGNIVLFFCRKGSFGFETEAIRYITKPVVSKFPDYKEAIPEDSKVIAKLTINRRELIKSLRKSLLFSNDGYERATFYLVKPDLFKISSSSNYGSFSEKIKVDMSSSVDELKLSVNPKFLIQSLVNLKSDNVVLSFTGEKSAMMITPEDDNCLAVIMPMVFETQRQ